MRIVFAGTPDFAASHLQALLDASFDVVAVYTQPDRPAGRGKKLTPSAVKCLALENDISVHQPATLKDIQAQKELSALAPDIMVVVAYGLILPKDVLEIPKQACINVHGSILPKWRGAAPIQRAVWAGDNETGVTIMHMNEGLDTGDIIRTNRIPISDNDTSASLYEKLAKLGPNTLVECLQNWHSSTRQAQDESLATYAAKLSKQEAYLDWTLAAEQLERNIRAFNPWPVAWFSHQETVYKVWQARTQELDASEQLQTEPGLIKKYDKTGLYIGTKDGVLIIEKLQMPGKKAQNILDIYNGQPTLFQPDTVLI